MATSPLPFWGAQEGGKVKQPRQSRGSPTKGTKSEVAASSLPSRGAKRGRKYYATRALSGVPNKGDNITSGCFAPPFSGAHKRAELLPYILEGAQQRGQNQKWLPYPCLARGPQKGTIAMQRLHSRGSPTRGYKIRSGYLTPVFSGAHKRAEVPCNPFILKGPQQRGQNQKWLPHPCLIVGQKKGKNSYVTLAFSGVTKEGEEVKHGCLTLAFSGDHKREQQLHNFCILGGSQPRGRSETWLPHSLLLRSPQKGAIAMQPLHSRGSPTRGYKIRSGYLTSAFSRAQKRANMLRNPYALKDP